MKCLFGHATSQPKIPQYLHITSREYSSNSLAQKELSTICPLPFFFTAASLPFSLPPSNNKTFTVPCINQAIFPSCDFVHESSLGWKANISSAVYSSKQPSCLSSLLLAILTLFHHVCPVMFLYLPPDSEIFNGRNHSLFIFMFPTPRTTHDT